MLRIKHVEHFETLFTGILPTQEMKSDRFIHQMTKEGVNPGEYKWILAIYGNDWVSRIGLDFSEFEITLIDVG